MSMNVRQSEVPPLITKRKSFVVDAQASEHGGVEVVDTHGLIVVNILVSQFIGAAPGQSALDASAGKKHGR